MVDIFLGRKKRDCSIEQNNRFGDVSCRAPGPGNAHRACERQCVDERPIIRRIKLFGFGKIGVGLIRAGFRAAARLLRGEVAKRGDRRFTGGRISGLLRGEFLLQRASRVVRGLNAVASNRDP